MSDESKIPSGTEPGSGTVPAQAGAGQAASSAAGGGQITPQQANPGASPSEDYKALEKKLGEQGQELGEYREFFQKVHPLLSKLDSNKELVQAVMDDKLDAKLVTAILGGKVKIEEAQQVADAHQQVKKEMGAQDYKAATPEEIIQKVLEKALPEIEGKVEQRFKNADEMREFEATVQDFISKTPDFPQYADKINAWLDENPDQDNIAVAYFAVKGIEAQQKSSKDSDVAVSEAAKQAALNAGGGATPSGGKIEPKKNMADELIGNRSNPNSFRF